MFIFGLAYVVLNMATTKETSGNSYFGLAIRFPVLVVAYAIGAILGGVSNPAVAVGVSFMGLSSWVNIWIFLVAELLGGAPAAYASKVIRPPADRPGHGSKRVAERTESQPRRLRGTWLVDTPTTTTGGRTYALARF